MATASCVSGLPDGVFLLALEARIVGGDRGMFSTFEYQRKSQYALIAQRRHPFLNNTANFSHLDQAAPSEPAPR
jgi:hypothetical protein